MDDERPPAEFGIRSRSTIYVRSNLGGFPELEGAAQLTLTPGPRACNNGVDDDRTG